MSTEISEDMCRDAFIQSPRPPAALVTISYEGLADPIRVTTWPGDLGNGVYGLVSRGETYRCLPMRVALGGAGKDGGAKGAKLEIAATEEVKATIRSAPAGIEPVAVVELVRVAAPDVVERAVRLARVTTSEIADGMVSVDLQVRDYSQEYAVAATYSLPRTPGLF